MTSPTTAAGIRPGRPVRVIGACLLAIAFSASALYIQWRTWTALQRYYFGTYLLTAIFPGTTGHHSVIEVEKKRAELVFAQGNDIVEVQSATRETNYALSKLAIGRGMTRVVIVEGDFNNAYLHSYLAEHIYGNRTVWDLAFFPLSCTALLMLVVLPFAVRLDLRAARIRKYGQKIRGPELVGIAEFNVKTQGDGLAIPTLEGSALRIPRKAENQHAMVMGDTGTGKSVLITHILLQVRNRNHGAVIYDPSGEQVQRFFRPGQDIVLNPLDARCPFWDIVGELEHEAEAMTIASSLVTDDPGKDGRFFTHASRKIFAHLLGYKPEPNELANWLAHPNEIDCRVSGTELASLIDPDAPGQRAGVLASLSLIADTLKLLPRRTEAPASWTARQWSQKREGFIFITSRHTVRAALRPFISLIIDLLVLRLMNSPAANLPPVWFMLDEVASLQYLPQLHTALTESRKSNNPIVLGFQGKSQLEALYDKKAEAMLSQPATKIFLKTSEPNAAEWISKSIGDIEIERLEESRTHEPFLKQMTSSGERWERKLSRVVLDAEIAGLPPLHAYVKYGNLVVPLHLAIPHVPKQEEDFTPRTPAGTGVPANAIAHSESVSVSDYSSPVFFE